MTTLLLLKLVSQSLDLYSLDVLLYQYIIGVSLSDPLFVGLYIVFSCPCQNSKQLLDQFLLTFSKSFNIFQRYRMHIIFYSHFIQFSLSCCPLMRFLFFFQELHPSMAFVIIVGSTSHSRSHHLPLDGILQIPNLSSLGILGTEPDYFPTQQPLL